MKLRRRRGYPVRKRLPQRIVVRVSDTHMTADQVRAFIAAVQESLQATQSWLGRGL